jgi:hypothetical protein
VRERGRVCDARFGRELLDERTDLREVARARAVQLALRVGDLQQDVDERAALEVVALEPLVEDVEDREQSLAGIDGSPLDCALKPVPGPALLAALEEREHERVLGGEVPVQGHPRDPGLLDDRVDADRADALTGEELVGGVEDALAGAGRRCRRLVLRGWCVGAHRDVVERRLAA